MTTRTLFDHARFALAVFVAVVCVTTLAPFMRGTSGQLVCSAQGSKLFVQADIHAPGDHDSGSDDHAAHCPLCMPAGGLPPSQVAWDASPVRPLDRVLQAIPAALLASLVGAPLPARGPPSMS